MDSNRENGEGPSEVDFIVRYTDVQSQFLISLPDPIYHILNAEDSISSDISDILSDGNDAPGDEDRDSIWWQYHENKGYSLLTQKMGNVESFRLPRSQGAPGGKSFSQRMSIPKGVRQETSFGELSKGDIVYFYTDPSLIGENDESMGSCVFLFTEKQWFNLLGFEGLEVTPASLRWVGPLNEREELQRDIEQIKNRIEDIEKIKEIRGELTDEMIDEKEDLNEKLESKLKEKRTLDSELRGTPPDV